MQEAYRIKEVVIKETRKIITYTLIMLSLIILYSGNTYAAKKVKNIQSYVWVKDKIVIGKGNRASLKQYGFYTVYSKKINWKAAILK